jgi:hypothetical protein
MVAFWRLDSATRMSFRVPQTLRSLVHIAKTFTRTLTVSKESTSALIQRITRKGELGV